MMPSSKDLGHQKRCSGGANREGGLHAKAFVLGGGGGRGGSAKALGPCLWNDIQHLSLQCQVQTFPIYFFFCSADSFPQIRPKQ